MKLNFRHPVWPWIGLTVILVLHAVAIQRLHPENYFGMHQDDSVYLSSAHSIAEGDGYVLPSVPGTPPATKYPVLYPWMLSWIWRANIPFPANIRTAIAISEFFTLAFGALAFLLLRRFRRINSLEALLLTAACVFHPAVMFLGANIMSDMPFCAFVLAALLLADSAMRPAAGIAKSALSACFTGLSILCRVLGVPVAAGIFISGVLRKSWRQAGDIRRHHRRIFRASSMEHPLSKIHSPSSITRRLRPRLARNVVLLHQLFRVSQTRYDGRARGLGHARKSVHLFCDAAPKLFSLSAIQSQHPATFRRDPRSFLDDPRGNRRG